MTTAEAWHSYIDANRRANHLYATQPTTTCLGITTTRYDTERDCKAIGDEPDNLCRACRATKEKP